MKRYFFLSLLAALAVVSCGKSDNGQSGTDQKGNENNTNVDANGVSSVLIREKGKGEFAKEADITIKLSDITATIEVKTDPADAASKIGFESEDVLIVRVTKQGNLYARRAGTTNVKVSIGETVYATAKITVVDDKTEENPVNPSDEKIRLDNSHWFFYCVVCDEFEPIAEASAHSGKHEFSTWFPYEHNIVLMEDLSDLWSYLPYQDDKGNYTYSYEIGADTYYDDFDLDAGDGLFFDLDPTAPYPGEGKTDPFTRGSLTVSFENEKYIAGPYTCSGNYRGVIGWADELDLRVFTEASGSSTVPLFHVMETSGSVVTLHRSVGDKLTVRLVMPYEVDGQYQDCIGRAFVDPEYLSWFPRLKSSDESIVKIVSSGNQDGEWQLKLDCLKAGISDITIEGGYARGQLGNKRTLHLIIQ